ncbi:hypothetical protein [Thalassomonas sp. M1454]|uniref:hypothetical protein n=1 Tax=Thalassomonas sp. M1454 TaxID=2594477 RepID=UPI00117BFC04|nr:hypothetical protein [Thalassomonas sp. M1454]TRX56482.1 hypothetical protein FNN08_02820 [Thalassomonas sp. M1454]
MIIYNITAKALIALGVLFFSSIFLKVIAGIDLIPDSTYLSHYFISFAGAMVLAWGLVMNKAANNKQAFPIVAYATGVMFILLAVMRVVAFFVAEQVFDFVPSLIAHALPAVESVTFFVLGFVFLTRYKS